MRNEREEPIWIFNCCVFIRKKGLIKFRIIEQRIKVIFAVTHPNANLDLCNLTFISNENQ